MADPKAEALARGDLPQAAGWVGAGVALGGGLGALAGAATAPWLALVQAGVTGDPATWELARAVALQVAGGTLAGAALGLALAQISLGAWAPRWRWQVQPGPAPRRLGAVALIGAAGAALWGPVAVRADLDPGRLLLAVGVASFGLGALGTAVAALLDRRRGLVAWRARVIPPQPPRRPPDEASPELRAAVSARGREAGPRAAP